MSTISLCMIVKNEEALLSRALATARIFADEIIVVDTGSTDGTRKIALDLADKVLDFKWQDDFSAARNYAFSAATKDYRMWLDADDVVPAESARAIARLKRKLDGTDVVMFPYVLERDGRGKPSYSYLRERIVKNSPTYDFIGRVHEAIPLYGNVIRRNIPIYHKKPSGKSSGTRNLDIYRKALSEGAVFTPRERYYYARELYYNDKPRQAAAEFESFVNNNGGSAANKIDASLMLARCRKKLGDNDGALESLYKSFLYGLPTGEIACEIALIYIERAKYGIAVYWLKRAVAAKPDYNSGAFIDNEYYGFIPYVWLCVCYDKLGKPKTAYRYHCMAKKIRPDHPSILANDKYFENLGSDRLQ